MTPGAPPVARVGDDSGLRGIGAVASATSVSERTPVTGHPGGRGDRNSRVAARPGRREAQTPRAVPGRTGRTARPAATATRCPARLARTAPGTVRPLSAPQPPQGLPPPQRLPAPPSAPGVEVGQPSDERRLVGTPLPAVRHPHQDVHPTNAQETKRLGWPRAPEVADPRKVRPLGVVLQDQVGERPAGQVCRRQPLTDVPAGPDQPGCPVEPDRRRSLAGRAEHSLLARRRRPPRPARTGTGPPVGGAARGRRHSNRALGVGRRPKR